MDITSVRAWIVAASLLSVCAVSQAAGLGKLNVRSALGEPFKAEVELVAEKSEMGSLSVRLANREAFERAGLAYTNVLAAIKASVEKRPSGEPYVLLTSSQPVNEPFVDLLLELTWSSGRLSREFTALLDPPSVIAEREKQKAAAPQVRAAPATPSPRAEPVPPPSEAPPPEEAAAAAPTMPQEPAAAEPAATETPATESTATEPAAPSPAEQAPSAPVETIGGSQPTLLGEGGDAQYPAGVDAYGPVRRGDTLTKIAMATKPADVSLEQMLVLLMRGNPDAFSGKNMNRLKTGKILQLPTSEQLAGVSPADARTEVRLQARNWRAYKEQLAAAAGEMTPSEEPAQQAASGKIGSTVQEGAPGAETPQEVLKLSKNAPQSGESAGGTQSAARIRALEEEVVARNNAVKEADSRVARLEKQISDLQALLAMRSKGPGETQSAPPAVPAPAQPEVKAPSPAPAPPATPAAPVAPAPTSQNEAPAPAQPAPVQPKAPTVRTVPPPPEPSLLDQFMEQPAYIGAAIGVLIIIGALAVRGVRRRRESKSDAEDSGPARGFAETPALAYGGLAGAGQGDQDDEPVRSSSEEVDPIAEAEIFLAYGRDAQAEELLKEALETSPRSNEIRLKLLQIYANRKDARTFEQVARELQQGTGGTGPLWEQAVVLGYQVDPTNARYADGAAASGAAAASAAAASAAAENVDFNIGSEDATAITATDIDLGDAPGAVDRTQIIDLAESAPQSFQSTSAPAMDFNVELPDVEPAASEAGVQQATSSSGLDFDIDLNTLTGSAPAAAKPDAGGLDFDMSGLSLDTSSAPRTESTAAAPEIDLSGISLDLGTETSPSAPTDKDDHWYDVQTKFDLAKAYQEMGDKDGAREILKEVLAEGDSEQKNAAKSVLTTLDS